MDNIKTICILLALCCSISSYPSENKSRIRFIYITDYGLLKSKTGVESYRILEKAHKDAVAKGCYVSYKGVKKIDIAIPNGATSIPLTEYTDFSGVTINVLNNNNDISLFIKSTQSEGKANLAKHTIDKGDFTNIPFLNKGKIILSIKDENKWVDKRIGYSYGHTRKDILLIENGHAVNRVVMPYDNAQSKPHCTYYEASEKPTVIKNLILNRNPKSKAKTFFVKITGCDNVLLDNITITTTPNDSIIEDKIIQITDCTNVKMRKIRINQTYSMKDKYGYGIAMDNVWKFEAESLYADGNWGVFGTRNINTVMIKYSEINRFDIHCYGKEVTFENTIFRNWYNKFSSVYGNISYHKCHFINFIPYHTDYSYNAYVPLNLSFDDCVWDVTSRYNCLIYMGYANDRINARPELVRKCWPNVHINNMKVNMSECVKTIVMFHVKGEVSQKCLIDYISEITLSDIAIISKPANCQFKRFILSDAKVKTKSKVSISANKSNCAIDTFSNLFCFPYETKIKR